MDNTLKIPLSLSLAGILILLFLAQQEAPLEKIGNINNHSYNFLNKKVKIEGMVINEKQYDTIKPFKILYIGDATGSIQVTCNCNPEKNLTEKTVQVTGKVSEYNKKIQINADEIALREEG